MTFDEPTDGTPVFAALSDQTRRRILAVLGERDHPVAVDALARFVSARETGRDPAAIEDGECSRMHRSLRHVHLPKLSNAGLVVRHGGTVEPATGPIATRATEWAATTAVDPAVDDGLEALADARRREVLTVLTRIEDPTSLADLAERVAAAAGPAVSADRVRIALDHLHLPKLADAGIVSYDREDRTVTYEGLPRPCERLLADLAVGDGAEFAPAVGDSLLVFPLD